LAPLPMLTSRGMRVPASQAIPGNEVLAVEARRGLETARSLTGLLLRGAGVQQLRDRARLCAIARS
jgi:hypothetical protein